MSHPVPKAGDVVTLNDNGLETIWGNKKGLRHMKTLKMRITCVDHISLTSPEKTYPVQVDNADINFFLIDHTCFDIVRD